MNTLTDVEFRPLVVPASITDPDASDFIEMVRVRNIVYREIAGHDDHAVAADELLPHFHENAYERRLMWLVQDRGEVVGRVGVDLPLEGDSKNLFWLIELRRSCWGRGIGNAAHDLIVSLAREHGRRVLQSWAEHPSAVGARLDAPTGYGDIPLDHVAQFYLHHGYTLEQIERCSAFDLRASFETVERLLVHAQVASADYEIVRWFAPTPAEFVAGYAWMKSRMVTDAPAANLEFDEETWDAARIARLDALYTEPGLLRLVTAARHVATGELCAFNELVLGKDRTEATHQEDTLVLKEHRGHKLGTLVKCSGLLTWHEIAPDSPRVITYNAEENRPMLDINEAIGFLPISYEGAWKRVLDD